MDAPISYRYGQVPRVLILHLRKACAHTCTSTHLRPRPKSQLVFRFDSVSQEKQEGRLASAVTAWPCLAAANSFCRAMLTGVGTLIQLQLVDSEGQVCVWALVIQPSLFVARRHRGQARPGGITAGWSWQCLHNGQAPLSCFNKGRERSPTPTKESCFLYSMSGRDLNLFCVCQKKEE